MQQAAQLCFNGNFLVDRSEYPPLALRVLTSSGGGGPVQTPRRVCSRWSTGPPFIRGAWGDPKHRGAIRPKPQCKLSRMSQLLTIYTNSPATSNLVCAPSSIMRARRVPRPDWHILGTGDYNNDGKSDILWRNSSGAVAIWEMNGISAIAAVVVANPGPPGTPDPQTRH